MYFNILGVKTSKVFYFKYVRSVILVITGPTRTRLVCYSLAVV